MSSNPGRIVPVILSGGAGTRLWPLSRQAFPKPFLTLTGDATMIQQTVARARGAMFAAPLVISGRDHRFLIAEQLAAAGAGDARIVLEPAGRNTAPAAAIAALMVAAQDPDALLLVMPSDHAIQDGDAFIAALTVARRAAADGALVAFGITPDRPETGYGYVKAGPDLAGVPGARRVDRFVEKPDLATAQSYLADGGYFWNSGMFLFQAGAFLEALAGFEPKMLACCRAALAGARQQDGFLHLDADAFMACPARSIDVAVMERVTGAAVVPVAMGWSDVGSWRALWEGAPHDAGGNAARGDVLAQDCTDSYLHSEGPLVAAVGLKDVVVVATDDAVLVSSRDAGKGVEEIVEKLAARGGERHVHHSRVHRPWGSYESVDSGPGFQVKRITVRPGRKLSLQMHRRRAEHWIVVAGSALVTCDDRQFPLKAGQSTFIPQGARHRLENPGTDTLHLIEVQCGAYLGEDDIVRFEDDYGRAEGTVAGGG